MEVTPAEVEAMERMYLEAALRRSWRGLEDLLEAMPGPAVILNAEGHIHYFNGACEEMSGYARLEVVGEPCLELFVPASLQHRTRETLDRALAKETGESCEIPWLTKSGEMLSITWRIAHTVSPLDGSVAVVLVGREARGKSQMHEETERRSSLLSAVMEATSDGILVLDRTGSKVLHCNRRFLDLLGMPGEMLSLEDGEQLLQHTSEQFVEPAAANADAFRRLVRETEAEIREVFRLKDGRVIESCVRPQRVDDNVVGIVSSHRDLTESKHMERQFFQAQKMEAVGRMAGGIAHDFNNLVTVILGFGELVQSTLDEQDPRHADLEEMRKAADRAATLTSQLLAFSRRQVMQPLVLDLNTVVRDTAKMLSRLIGEDIDLIFQLDPSLAHIRADRGMMEQVIMNLAVNARDAMPGGGKLMFRTMNVELDQDYADRHQVALAVPGPHVMLAVSDTGAGMDPEVQVRVFEPFFTTKETGQGTGLGLSTAYGIIKQSEGYIWVDSEVGLGSTFEIYLPAVYEEITQLPEEAPPGRLTGSENILLVEDDAGLRKVIEKLLMAKGYHVLSAGSSRDALAMVDRLGTTVHLLLSDFVLPGMNGVELARILKTRRPGLKVLLMSGYTEFSKKLAPDPGGRFLAKPFSPRSLMLKVRQTLDSPPGSSGRE